MKLHNELLIILIGILAFMIFGYYFQEQITYNSGLGWDGRDYFKIAQDFNSHNLPVARAPFVYRLGTSYLVSTFFSNNMMDGFKIINILASVLVIFAIWYFLYTYGTNYLLRLLLVLSYLSYWQSPLRLSYFYPVHSDPIGVLFLFINLIISFKYYNTYKKQYLYWLILTSFIGVFFREITLIPSIALIISSIKYLSKYKINYDKLTLIPLAIGLLAIAITHIIAQANDSYHFINSAIGWIYRKSTIMYLHSILLSVGPIILICLYYYKESIEILKNDKFLSSFLVLILFVSYAGGSDTERLIMWGAPAIYVIIAKLISNHKEITKNKLLMVVLFISQMLVNRVFMPTPDYNYTAKSVFPILTPLASNFRLLDLWAIHADSRFILISAIQYFLLSILVIILIKYTKKL